MWNPFKKPLFNDPALGGFRRSHGTWRGTLVVDGTSVPLLLCGPHSGPDPEALRVAQSLAMDLPSWRPVIERELYEHYEPYAEAVREGAEVASGGLPAIDRPASVWPHAKVLYVLVAPLDGRLAVEIGYAVAWDEEHTLGARFREGKLLELCGSVLPPFGLPAG